MLLLQQMIVLFIYIMAGYISSKMGVMDEEFSKKISWLVVNIANPAMTISAVVNGEGSIKGRELLLTVGLAVIILGGTILISQFLPALFRVKKEQRNVYKLLAAFNNIGFMGFPVIVAVYGEEALLYASIFTMLFNVLIYTYGIQVIQGRKSDRLEWGKILNIGVLSSVFAILIYFAQIPTPSFFNTAMSGMSGLTSPLSMIVIGISLAGIELKVLFQDVQMLLFSLAKLLVIPILGMFILRRAVDNEMLCGVCMVMLATPSASMTAMMARQYGDSECAKLAAKGVALTTMLSVITIPIVSAVVQL